ncbi:membrane protein insertion efficiency factor YidD [Marinibactrum halimedae]|uniref:Putative membrane protein insertion efficiency factor n=1 Tax=Marinibactrum halimedae TaxID=1444977 RepID=A0AA37T755_9GAMM|nr:membrane protein insertion efficiency factor YidD [Marinibactrum halimedae]MCD9460016.1 membrane protein insertion efficiency factor YidD [Marinibactrum halimedae]GLS28214.1 putative membrane protein insertion efficiency factor [Marinibactrum halimedae]
MTQILLALIKVYRYLASPWVGNQCRFYPTCSMYAEDAIKIHGPAKGCYLSILRILRCNPWSKGGLDYVPGSIDDEDTKPHCEHNTNE